MCHALPWHTHTHTHTQVPHNHPKLLAQLLLKQLSAINMCTTLHHYLDYVYRSPHAHTLLLRYSLSLEGCGAGLRPIGLWPVYSQLKILCGWGGKSHARLPWAMGLLGAWPLTAVDGVPFVTQATRTHTHTRNHRQAYLSDASKECIAVTLSCHQVNGSTRSQSCIHQVGVLEAHIGTQHSSVAVHAEKTRGQCNGSSLIPTAHQAWNLADAQPDEVEASWLVEACGIHSSRVPAWKCGKDANVSTVMYQSSLRLKKTGASQSKCWHVSHVFRLVPENCESHTQPDASSFLQGEDYIGKASTF